MPLSSLNPKQRQALAKKLRRIAATDEPADEWNAIASELRRQADELDPPPATPKKQR